MTLREMQVEGGLFQVVMSEEELDGGQVSAVLVKARHSGNSYWGRLRCTLGPASRGLPVCPANRDGQYHREIHTRPQYACEATHRLHAPDAYPRTMRKRVPKTSEVTGIAAREGGRPLKFVDSLLKESLFLARETEEIVSRLIGRFGGNHCRQLVGRFVILAGHVRDPEKALMPGESGSSSMAW